MALPKFIYFSNFLSTVLIQYSSLVMGWYACCMLRWNLLLPRWEKSAPILFCFWIFLGWTKGGVPGGIRTRDCRTAARRAYHIATLHSYIATPHPKFKPQVCAKMMTCLPSPFLTMLFWQLLCLYLFPWRNAILWDCCFISKQHLALTD